MTQPEAQTSQAQPREVQTPTTCQQCGQDAQGSALCAPCWAEAAGDVPWLRGYLTGLVAAGAGAAHVETELRETRSRLARIGGPA